MAGASVLIRGILTNAGLGRLIAGIWALDPASPRGKEEIKRIYREIMHESEGILQLESGTSFVIIRHQSKLKQVTHYRIEGRLERSDYASISAHLENLHQPLTTRDWQTLQGDELDALLPWPIMKGVQDRPKAVSSS